MLPQVNACVLAIAKPGWTEDLDRPAGTPGAAVVSGPVDAYYRETVQTVYSSTGGGMNTVKDVRILIPSDFPGVDQVTNGLVVTFTYQGRKHARRIQESQSKYLSGVPNLATTLHLDPAAVEQEADDPDTDPSAYGI